MDARQHAQIVSFIWNIADDVLRGPIKRTKYRDVILPMTVIRRLDALLEPTKDDVIRASQLHADLGEDVLDGPLKAAAGQKFYNASPFTLKQLLNNPQNLLADLITYLDGFSTNVRQILEQFQLRSYLHTLNEQQRLGLLIEKFTSPSINLSPQPHNGLPGLDNHGMGTIFEELLRRFNEDNNEEAGEYFTPRDVVTLMTDLVVLPAADDINERVFSIYDGACGTGGMLSVARERILQIASGLGVKPTVNVYGQEANDETWAIAQADQLVQGLDPELIRQNSTLSHDAFPTRTFDFMLSNPPYGISWKGDLEALGGRTRFADPRFLFPWNGDPQYSLLTRSSDGQLLFLANLVSKMKDLASNGMGSRIAEIHNGSSLFTGDAGGGESNVRRYIIENDWLEAIIALPNNMFYNTGIATYIWVISNNKEPRRRGLVQLIDATAHFTPRRKNLGAKNADLSDANIQWIMDQFLSFAETPQSKILPNQAFGYRKVIVERPLRLALLIPADNPGLNDDLWQTIQRAAADLPADQPTEAAFWTVFQHHARAAGIRPTAALRKRLRDALTARSDAGETVIASRRPADPSTDQPNRLAGESRQTTPDGQLEIITPEPDPDLRDTENVPLTETVDDFMAREVWPYAPDAFVPDPDGKIGYEISFTRYFYQPRALRSLNDIEADIRALAEETTDLLTAILGE